MMQAFDGLYVACPQRLAHHVESRLGDTLGLAKYDGLVFWRIAAKCDVGALFEDQAISVSPWLLDRFTLVYDDRVGSTRHEVQRQFFSAISGTYDNLIDKKRNLENISLLYNILASRIESIESKKILDFGCGSGLSTEALGPRADSLVGVDDCVEMRRQARDRGLAVLAPDQLERLNLAFFGGAFSSYVLHFQPSASTFEMIWDKLDNRGVMAANFHNGIGVGHAVAIFNSLGAISERVEIDSASSGRHGEIYVFSKK